MTGFTLLEVMIAISIAAIVIVGLFHMESQTVSMGNSVQFYTIAPELAQGKMTEIETSSSLKSMKEDSGGFSEEFAGYNWSYQITDMKSGILGPAGDAVKQIDLTVGSTGEGLSYDLRSYVLLGN